MKIFSSVQIKIFKGVFQAASESADGWCTVQGQNFFISYGPCRGALCGQDFRVGGVAVDCFFLTLVLEEIPGKIKVTNPPTPSLDMNQMTRRVSIG